MRLRRLIRKGGASMVTIRMIAKECGCSTATVSKALNGAPDVSAETAQRIRKTAAEMGYMPNSAARALKTSRSYNFGVLLELNTPLGLTHEFFARIINGFKTTAEELGYDISFISQQLGGRNIGYAEHARYRNCDGVLIACSVYSNPAVLELVNSGIPVVTIDCIFEQCSSVQSDNVQGIYDLVHHAYEKGHRKIALIHGEDTPVTRIRVASFYRVCRELGLTVPEDYIQEAIYNDSLSTARATRRLLELPNPPSCILFPDDIAYIGGMNEIEKMGLSIPEDVSVMGYDGLKISQMFRPRLTTIQQDADAMGASAARALAHAVDAGKEYLPERITIPGKLLSGGTVGEIK